MKDNPAWIDVTKLMLHGPGAKIKELVTNSDLQAKITEYINRLNAIDNVKQVDLHIEEVAGEDKTVEVVVDIFNRVNSGGTKLSKGDLALAKICAESPDAGGILAMQTYFDSRFFIFRVAGNVRSETRDLLAKEARRDRPVRRVADFAFRNTRDRCQILP